MRRARANERARCDDRGDYYPATTRLREKTQASRSADVVNTHVRALRIGDDDDEDDDGGKKSSYLGREI